ncbi:MAG: DUF4342 domain-containing protein [Ardenticatenaceae bacterium]|nr:DUF4342 domain-containing protein [Anaerolineales bacterium]MCB8982430.1 DUF4342 domain-containing protein [Ardenticatenaceae bacterium]MCB8986243.1 DUF4342 domain-containing protein [Ardenticatenaceae bacterium]
MNEEKENFVNEEEIPVMEDEETTEEGKSWSEEFVVAGGELVGMVKKLVKEATVRRLVIKNEKMNLHLEVPLVMGVAGIAMLPVYSAVALIAALVTDCTILVERREPVQEKEPEMAAEA